MDLLNKIMDSCGDLSESLDYIGLSGGKVVLAAIVRFSGAQDVIRDPHNALANGGDRLIMGIRRAVVPPCRLL
jgi:hypothetical protein